MRTTAFKPGQIWPGEALSSQVLEAQWAVELHHRRADFTAAGIAFSEDDWAALEWNAREALHLNHRWSLAPRWWRHLFLPQEDINTHLMRSLELVLGAWHQWTHLPHERVINNLPARAEVFLILNNAKGRLEEAAAKQASLTARKRLLQHFSLRQWRLYQHLSAFLNDLTPLVAGLEDFNSRKDAGGKAIPSGRDILWHARELQSRVGRPGRKPGQLERLRAPRLEINRMLGASCLYHRDFLKDSMHPD